MKDLVVDLLSSVTQPDTKFIGCKKQPCYNTFLSTLADWTISLLISNSPNLMCVFIFCVFCVWHFTVSSGEAPVLEFWGVLSDLFITITFRSTLTYESIRSVRDNS